VVGASFIVTLCGVANGASVLRYGNKTMVCVNYF